MLETGAQAHSFRQGVSAFNRQDYMQAHASFIPLAEWGNPSAQAYLGFMFETGRGVPLNYTEAAMWYRRARTGRRPRAIFVGTALWLMAGYRWWRGLDELGLGDIKLAAAAGAWLGLVTLFAGLRAGRATRHRRGQQMT